LVASPLALPIDAKQGITCFTCHDNGCESGHQKMSLRFYDRKELRSDLCWICHDRTEFSRRNPHVDDPSQCERCHVSRPMKGAKASALLAASPKMVCLLCHDVKPHPVGADHLRVPSDRIHPDGSLPMGAAGEVTCATCHDPHAQEAPRLKRLRVEAAGLCGRCHWR
jgi:predicted CXXCH cytochrome family protein